MKGGQNAGLTAWLFVGRKRLSVEQTKSGYGKNKGVSIAIAWLQRRTPDESSRFNQPDYFAAI